MFSRATAYIEMTDRNPNQFWDKCKKKYKRLIKIFSNPSETVMQLLSKSISEPIGTNLNVYKVTYLTQQRKEMDASISHFKEMLSNDKTAATSKRYQTDPEWSLKISCHFNEDVITLCDDS